MTTFVLIHGAWLGGWCYKRTADILRGKGHTVYTPTLTGLGERSHLINRLIDLDTHIADIAGMLKWEELSDVVLCGHSDGGMAVSSIADRMPGTIRSLVYLNATVPKNGQNVFDLLAPGMEEAIRDGVEANGRGYLMMPFPAGGFNVNERDRAWVNSKLTPHPLKCFEQKVVLGDGLAKIRKRTFVYASGWADNMLDKLYERLTQDPAWNAHSIDCGHFIMIDRPAELAELLLAAA